MTKDNRKQCPYHPTETEVPNDMKSCIITQQVVHNETNRLFNLLNRELQSGGVGTRDVLESIERIGFNSISSKFYLHWFVNNQAFKYEHINQKI